MKQLISKSCIHYLQLFSFTAIIFLISQWSHISLQGSVVGTMCWPWHPGLCVALTALHSNVVSSLCVTEWVISPELSHFRRWYSCQFYFICMWKHFIYFRNNSHINLFCHIEKTDFYNSSAHISLHIEMQNPKHIFNSSPLLFWSFQQRLPMENDSMEFLFISISPD